MPPTSSFDLLAPEIIQQTALFWLSSYLQFNPSTIIPFTPDLIPLILPNLAHHVDGIRSSARGCNGLLWSVIKDLEISDNDPADEATTSSTGSLPNPPQAQAQPPLTPAPTGHTRRNSNVQQGESGSTRSNVISPQPSQLAVPVRGRASLKGDGAETPQTYASGSPVSEKITLPSSVALQSTGLMPPPPVPLKRVTAASTSEPPTQTAQPSSSTIVEGQTQTIVVPNEPSRSASPLLVDSSPDSMTAPGQTAKLTPNDPFDYLATVDALRIQFMGEHEDTRVSALKWLIMLHQKIPKKACSFLVPQIEIEELMRFFFFFDRFLRWMMGPFLRC